MDSYRHNWGTPPWTVDFRPRSKPLPQSVNFAVIGGGFAGLSAAAWLKKLSPQNSVLVLEAHTIGDGASGRTGGMALAETAAGNLPGLGDVLTGYQKLLRDLKVDAELAIPGAYELARHTENRFSKRSPIRWNDSGILRVVNKVSGGTVNPGKVVAGLARAAERLGVLIAEHTQVTHMAARKRIALRVRSTRGKHRATRASRAPNRRTVTADRVVLCTNAFALGVSGLLAKGDPYLTLALKTAPLTKKVLTEIGLAHGHPFYTVDFPYLWGRTLRDGSVIFGSGLVTHASKNLERVDVRKGYAKERMDWLESRVHQLHPALAEIKITHRWGGPILLTEKFLPMFHYHRGSDRVITLAGFSGHGVALSVYLGKWAAEATLGLRKLPHWPHT